MHVRKVIHFNYIVPENKISLIYEIQFANSIIVLFNKMLSGIWLLFVVHRIPQSVIMPLNLWWNNHFNPVFNISSIISRLLVVMDIVNPVVRETQIEDTNIMAKRKKTKGQTIIYKILRIKLKIEQHEPIKVGGKLKCH